VARNWNLARHAFNSLKEEKVVVYEDKNVGTLMIILRKNSFFRFIDKLIYQIYSINVYLLEKLHH
jgi:hypothetical protein